MKPLIVANWKCNPSSLSEAKKLFLSIKRGGGRQNTETVICPPYIYIPALKTIAGKKIKLGAQDLFWQEGAFTGEISAKMLRNIGCKYVIVGHSERRALGETDEMINRKLKAAILAKLSPILCIGESKKEREEGKTKEVLEGQLTLGLKNITRSKIQNSKFVIAYEPIWSIGTGRICPFDEAMSMKLLIRKNLTQIFSKAISKKIRIIYGGSVNSSVVEGYIKESIMDGVLVGGASLEAKEFIAILKKF